MINSITDDTFQREVLNSRTPVLVDFWAPWCGPCKALEPTLKQAATAYGAKLKVVKVDIDASPNTPARYGVRGVPTLALFKDGQLLATRAGALTKAQLTEFIDQQLA
jgi:thioredoxin 1